MKKALLWAVMAASPAWALNGRLQDLGDWLYACDSSGVCRVAGYQREGQPPVSVLLTRASGADAPVTAALVLQTARKGQPAPDVVTLHANGQDLGPVRLQAAPGGQGRGALSDAQAQALVAALLKGAQADVRLSAGQMAWQLSMQGVGSALLGVDLFQKRVGTPSAWTSPGPSAQAVPPPPLPVVARAPVSAEPAQVLRAGDAAHAKLRALLQDVDKAYRQEAERQGDKTATVCPLLAQAADPRAAEALLYPLNARHVLAVTPCDQAGGRLTLVFVHLSSDWSMAHRYLRVEMAGGFDAQNLPAYRAGVVTNHVVLAETGDCARHESWVWNGQHLELASSMSTGLCRGFAGGAWQLPLRLSDVRGP